MGNGVQREGEEVERRRVAHQHDDGGHQAREPLGGFERGRGQHLGDDGQTEVDPVVHATVSCFAYLNSRRWLEERKFASAKGNE